MKFRNSLLVIISIFSMNAIFAQDSNEASHTISINIPEIALLDLESAKGTAISLNGTAPTEAGEKVVFNAINNDIWINYSSIVGSSTEPTRKIVVQITDGSVPDGLELTVIAGNDAGQGDGTMGKPTRKSIVLSTKKARKIIDGVGSAYTGNGPNKGHNLTYTLSQSSKKGSYASLDFNQSESISITYTLTDN